MAPLGIDCSAAGAAARRGRREDDIGDSPDSTPALPGGSDAGRRRPARQRRMRDGTTGSLPDARAARRQRNRSLYGRRTGVSLHGAVRHVPPLPGGARPGHEPATTATAAPRPEADPTRTARTKPCPTCHARTARRRCHQPPHSRRPGANLHKPVRHTPPLPGESHPGHEPTTTATAAPRPEADAIQTARTNPCPTCHASAARRRRNQPPHSRRAGANLHKPVRHTPALPGGSGAGRRRHRRAAAMPSAPSRRTHRPRDQKADRPRTAGRRSPPQGGDAVSLSTADTSAARAGARPIQTAGTPRALPSGSRRERGARRVPEGGRRRRAHRRQPC